MAQQTRPVTYEEAARITAVGSHEYQANIHPDYSFGSAAHGGFMNALVLKTVGRHFATTLRSYDQPDTIHMHAEFLRSATNGEVRLHVRDVALGRGSSRVSVSMFQGGKERVLAVTTNVNRAKTQGISVSTGYQLDPPVPSVDADAFANGTDPNWVRFWAPWTEGSTARSISNVCTAFPRTPPPSGDQRAVRGIWLTPANPAERWTTEMLGLVVDDVAPWAENFFADSPHSVRAVTEYALRCERHGPPEERFAWAAPRWYSTMNMTLDFKRALPPEGVKWLLVRLCTKRVVDGRFDVTCEVWDEERRLVMVSQQLWAMGDLSGVAFPSAWKERKPSKI